MIQEKKINLMPRHRFLARVVRNSILGLCLIAFGLVLGMIGYHVFEGMPWIDAFVNAAMILSGMGPVGSLQTTGGKMFAGFYALFSGLFFILVVGIMLAPLAHRTFQKLGIENQKDRKDSE